ncbi:hypothetical protein SALBM311S_03169 [Streptomyces alboniger]
MAAAQHQLPFPLRLGGGAVGAAERAPAGRTRHRLPRQQRLRGRGSGTAAGLGRYREARCRRGGGGVPRLDLRQLRHLHLDGRRPERLGRPPRWVRTVPTPNSSRGPHRGPQAHLYGPEASGRDRRPGQVRTPSSGVRVRALLRQRRRNGSARRLPRAGLRRHPGIRRVLHCRRGAGRLRSAGLPLLGLRAAGRRTGHRRCRQGDGQRSPPGGGDHPTRDRRRLPFAGLFLLDWPAAAR